MKEFGFKIADCEGCPCWTFNNAKHGITLAVWLEPTGIANVTKSTTRHEPVEVQQCIHDVDAICDTMKSFLV
jgi:hypothetical protein